jgi:thioredoxin 1
MPLSRFTPRVVTPLTTMAELDGAIARSSAAPILIFKHSTTCGLSLMAAEEVADLLDGAGAPVDAEVFVVDVRGGREISRAIAERLKVRHDSPQVLLVHQGVVVWHRSHAGVTASAISEALSRIDRGADRAGVERPGR